MEEERKFLGVGKNVFFTGLVSFFMDVSSEMIYPLIPLFLANVLGAEKSLIGLVEGIAEATASLLKVFSGWFSDRIGNRKGLMAAGYAISTLSRLFVALAVGWQAVLGSRFMDRFGKGIRTSPRDAIIAESTDRKFLGRAFGFHRSMDTMGAVVGPGLAFFLLWIFSNDYRKVFWLSMVPGLFAVLLIIFFITEKKSRLPRDSERPKLTLKHFDGRFRWFLLVVTVFAIGNSSDVFLILRAQQVGIATVTIPVVYCCSILSILCHPSLPVWRQTGLGEKGSYSAGLFCSRSCTTASQPWQMSRLFGFCSLYMEYTWGLRKEFRRPFSPP